MKSNFPSFLFYSLSTLLFIAVGWFEGEQKIQMFAWATMTMGIANYLKSNEE